MTNVHRFRITKKFQKNPLLIADESQENINQAYPLISTFDRRVQNQIIEYFISTNDKKIFEFANSVGPCMFEMDRYRSYKKYREINKNDSNSIEVLTIKYGSKELAEEKQSEQFQKRKNVYDPEYISKKKNISIEEAMLFVQNYKKNKVTSKEGFIRRHGLAQGELMFLNFQKTSKKSSNFEYWLSTYEGTTPAQDWIARNRRKSKRCIEYWTCRGASYDEALYLVSQYQKNTSGVHEQYYLNQGYTQEEIEAILNQINEKRDGSSIDGIRKKYPNLDEEEILARYQKICSSKSHSPTFGQLLKTRNTLEKNGIWIPLEYLSMYQMYIREVRKITSKQLIHTLPNYSLRGLSGTPGAYQLDHIFSISQGFIQNIPAEIIGSIHNLRMIPWEVNNTKQGKCDITKEELLEKYWNNQNEN